MGLHTLTTFDQIFYTHSLVNRVSFFHCNGDTYARNARKQYLSSNSATFAKGWMIQQMFDSSLTVTVKLISFNFQDMQTARATDVQSMTLKKPFV